MNLTLYVVTCMFNSKAFRAAVTASISVIEYYSLNPSTLAVPVLDLADICIVLLLASSDNARRL